MSFEKINVTLMRNNNTVPWGFTVREERHNEYCVSSIQNGSMADKSGIRVNDIIQEMFGISGNNIKSLLELRRKMECANELTIVLKRHLASQQSVRWATQDFNNQVASNPYRLANPALFLNHYDSLQQNIPLSNKSNLNYNQYKNTLFNDQSLSNNNLLLQNSCNKDIYSINKQKNSDNYIESNINSNIFAEPSYFSNVLQDRKVPPQNFCREQFLSQGDSIFGNFTVNGPSSYDSEQQPSNFKTQKYLPQNRQLNDKQNFTYNRTISAENQNLNNVKSPIYNNSNVPELMYNKTSSGSTNSKNIRPSSTLSQSTAAPYSGPRSYYYPPNAREGETVARTRREFLPVESTTDLFRTKSLQNSFNNPPLAVKEYVRPAYLDSRRQHVGVSPNVQSASMKRIGQLFESSE